MLANKLNYGDTIGVVGVSNFLNFSEEDAEERYQEFESVFVNQKMRKFHRGEKKIIRGGNSFHKWKIFC